MSRSKLPLWQLLIDRGLCSDRKDAEAMVLAGLVRVGDGEEKKAGERIPVDMPIHVKETGRYASRGGEKLEGALADFGLDVRGVVALDAGASTGGFTDCLLNHGAHRVYAVDTGYGQLAGRLRNDPRVVNMERCNLGAIEPGTLEPAPTIVTLDLSYLSLRQALPIARKIVAESARFVCLVKPLFEIEDPLARRTGVIRGVDAYRTILIGLGEFMTQIGLYPTGVTVSPIEGSHGTVEFFYLVDSVKHTSQLDVGHAIDHAITRVQAR